MHMRMHTLRQHQPPPHHEDAGLRPEVRQEGGHAAVALQRHILHNHARRQRDRQQADRLCRLCGQHDVHVLVVLL
jgi:hypothetical protein